MASRALVLAEQLPGLVAGRRAELVRGEVIERTPVDREHSALVRRLLLQLDAFVTEHRPGETGTGAGFVLARGPDVVRASDVFFLEAARLRGAADDGYFEGAPDLAVEVLSPEDRACDVQQKIGAYLAAGSRLVWIVDPRTETVTVHHPTGEAHRFAGNEAITADPVLPGFDLRPADLFARD